MSQNNNPILYLLCDYADGPWQGVIQAWCANAGQDTLVLTDDPQRANGYLIVARDTEKAATALRGLDTDIEVFWIDDYARTVRAAVSPQAMLARLGQPEAAQSHNLTHALRRATQTETLP